MAPWAELAATDGDADAPLSHSLPACNRVLPMPPLAAPSTRSRGAGTSTHRPRRVPRTPPGRPLSGAVGRGCREELLCTPAAPLRSSIGHGQEVADCQWASACSRVGCGQQQPVGQIQIRLKRSESARFRLQLAAATRAAATATTGKRIHGWLRIACRASMRHAACLGQEGSEASVISPMYTGDRAERLSISSIYRLYT
eukprot:COSAG01_NODE_5589_length_4160_cov_2.299926_6_plen_198_part_01